MEKILVVLPVCPKDLHLATNVLTWMSEMKQQRTHRLLLSVSGIQKDEVEALKIQAETIFVAVDHVEFPDDVPHMAWPIPHNQQFGRTARVLSMRRKKPPQDWIGAFQTHFLWLEADAVPLVPNWLEILEAQLEIARANDRWFMGDYVKVPRDDPKAMNTPDHMSGVAVYPMLLSHFSQTAVTSMHTAWDVASASEVLPQAFFTKTIHHLYYEPTFKDRGDFEMLIRKEAVLFHQSKDGAVIRLLRFNINAMREDEPVLRKVKSTTPKGGRVIVPPKVARVVWEDWHDREMTHAEITAKHGISQYITRKILRNPKDYKIRVETLSLS